MTRIATHNPRKADVPQGSFNWPTFSEFALTFDPLSEAKDELNHTAVNAKPSDIWTTVELRYFLYCWQRIGNNRDDLEPEGIEKIQAALSILHAKIQIDNRNLNHWRPNAIEDHYGGR